MNISEQAYYDWLESNQLEDNEHNSEILIEDGCQL